MDIKELKSKIDATNLQEKLRECMLNKGECFLDKENNEIKIISIDKIDDFIKLSNIPQIGKNILKNCWHILHENDIEDFQAIYEYLFVRGHINFYDSLSLCEKNMTHNISNIDKITLEILDYIEYYLKREKNEGQWLFEGTSIDNYNSSNGYFYSVGSICQQINEMISLNKEKFVDEFSMSIINDIIHAYIYYTIENDTNYHDDYFN